MSRESDEAPRRAEQRANLNDGGGYAAPRAAPLRAHPSHCDGEAERLLLAAVLLRAARDLALYSRNRTPDEQRIAEEALEWISDSVEEDAAITTFHNICLVMNLDSDKVRARLLSLVPQEELLPKGDGPAEE